jgi:hypothetical protein
MISCKELVKKINQTEKLSVVQRAEIKMHALMCKHCGNYMKQMTMMKVGFAKLFKNKVQPKPDQIQDLEEKVLNKVKNDLDKKS